MPQLIAAILTAALLVGALHRRWPKAALAISVAAPASGFLWLAVQAPTIIAGHEIIDEYAWAPRFGVSAAFLLDGLSLMFGLVITGIGTIINAYAIPYMHEERPKLGRLLSLLLFFQAAMLGVALADDVLALYVSWELTSISSFFLIGFKNGEEESRNSALQALIVTALGGLALLTGLLLLGVVATDAGLTFAEARRLSELEAIGATTHKLYAPILLLVALGAFTKSAHVPFHFWLPSAMVAPTPVSAYLHSATMVKAGIYILARLTPTLGGTGLWTGVLGIGGGVTMVVAALMAVAQRDLKLILAYSTITVLGALTMLLGLGHPAALNAFVLFLLAHALYKAALFMVAGNVDHATGSRDAYRVGALARVLPGTAAVAAISAASMAGLPPLLGFLGKEGLYVAALEADGWAASIAAAAVATAGTLLVVAALVVAVAPFFRTGDGRLEAHPLPSTMARAPGALVLATVVIGILPGWANTFTNAVTNSIAARPVPTDVALWHGIKPPYGIALAFSAGSVLVGLLGYRRLSNSPPLGILPEGSALRGWTPSALYRQSINLLGAGAEWIAGALQSGKLRNYLSIILLTVLAAVGIPLGFAVFQGIDPPKLDTYPYEILLVVVAVIGALKTIHAHHRLEAVAALGATGFAIAFLFALLSAPDLAITQLMVETLIVIIAVLVFRRIPPASKRLPMMRRPLHMAISVAFGLLMTTLVLAFSRFPFVPQASDFFIRDQLGKSGGGNIVNAILVEYRALDTLGEITVLATAGIGVITLLRLGGGSSGDGGKN